MSRPPRGVRCPGRAALPAAPYEAAGTAGQLALLTVDMLKSRIRSGGMAVRVK